MGHVFDRWEVARERPSSPTAFSFRAPPRRCHRGEAGAPAPAVCRVGSRWGVPVAPPRRRATIPTAARPPSSTPAPAEGGRGGRKKWTPGNSGSQQKARAKELRLEQERRKAERERATRTSASSATGARRRERRRRASARPPARPPASSHSERHVGLVDAAPARRELKRLFGRVEHGGGASQRTGRAVELEHVRVIVADTGPEERRKSGAAAWSQRMRKGGEREMPLADFLALGASSPSPGASGSPVAANAAVFPSSPGGDRASWNALVREPPYHLVLRVVARSGRRRRRR